MSNIVKTLAAAQFKLGAIQKDMANTEFEGAAGGGLVKVRMTGDHAPKGVVIHPDVLKEDVETVQELVYAALVSAHQQIEGRLKEKTAGLQKSLNPLGIRFPG